MVRQLHRLAINGFVLIAGGFIAQLSTAAADTLAVVGDSLSAGYLNGSLHQTQQPRGFASVVARQAGTDLPLALIDAPGIPAVLKLKRGTGAIGRSPGVSTGRVDPRVQTFNLAVPGATAYHALMLRPDLPIDSLTDLVLGLPGIFSGELRSQVEWAQELEPGIVFLWVGGQDALLGLINGTDAAATDPNSFAVHFENIVSDLAGTGATIFVANVPMVTDIPFLLSLDEAAAFFGLDGASLAFFLNIDPAVSVTLDALGPIAAVLQGDPAAFPERDPATCFVIEGANVPDPDPNLTCDDYILTVDEITLIEEKVAAYNTIITNVVDAYDQTNLVDIQSFFADLADGGIRVDGQVLTNAFLGGAFSLDGIHPTFTGYALIADEFIAAINAAAGDEVVAQISRRQFRSILRSDPLVFHDPLNPPTPLGPVFTLDASDTVFRP